MSVIDDTFAHLSKEEAAGLQRVREIVQRTVPEAEEVITYSMPGFRYKDKYLVSFAAFKDHLSLFPGALKETHKLQLKDFKQSKGTIQFGADKPIPEDILVDILQTRVAEIERG